MSNDNNQLNIRMDADLKRAFIAKAKADGTSATELLIDFMRRYLGLESTRPTAIDPTAIENTLQERLDTRLVEIEQRLSERIAILEQQLGEFAA